MEHIIFVKAELKKLGHSDLSIGFELGLIRANSPTRELADDTCAVITSAEYLQKFGSYGK